MTNVQLAVFLLNLSFSCPFLAGALGDYLTIAMDSVAYVSIYVPSL